MIPVDRLQRTAGNSAVVRLLGRSGHDQDGADTPRDERSELSAPPLVVQTKLSTTSPEDPSERAAEAVATRVQRHQPAASSSAEAGAHVANHRPLEPAVMKRAPTGTATGPAVAPAVENYISGISGGAAISDQTRSRIEPQLGADLGGVRVHTGPEAAAAAAALRARAFTSGSDIFLGEGESPNDLGLMAHEATHVVQQGAAEDTVLRLADGFAYGTNLYLTIHHGANTVAYELELTSQQQADFAADPGRARRLALDLEYVFNPSATPLFEGTDFLASAAVSGRIRRDLDSWVNGRGLTSTNDFLTGRQLALRRLTFLFDVERYLEQRGYAPGTIDWVSAVPALLAEQPPPAADLVQASVHDRYHLFLRALQTEASQRPSVVAPNPPGSDLGPILRGYVDNLPLDAWGPDAPSIYSEAFLAHWVLQMAGLEYIPDGFDLQRFAPTASQADLDREREVLVAEFVADWMPGLVMQYVMDSWATSGITEDGYLEAIDMEVLRDRILDQLTATFMSRAITDDRYRRALRNAAHELARFRLFGLLVMAGQRLEKTNADLVREFSTTPAVDLDSWQHDVAADPYGYYREAASAANATFRMLTLVQGGADLWATLDQVMLPAQPQFGFVIALLDVCNHLKGLQDERDRQRQETRQSLKGQLNLSYDQVAATIRTMWDFADTFISKHYIPKLKEVALRRVAENRDQLANWLKNWDTQTPRLVATYRLSAFAMRDVAAKLTSGDATTAEIDGIVITADNVSTLTDAATAMEAIANRLESDDGAEEKKEELQEAIDGYDDVRENIVDGTYPPYEWGRTVAAEARAALGVGEFPEFTTYRMIFSGQVSASQNPFLARAIATWEFRERLEPDLFDIALFFAAALLTVASLLTGGVAGLILAAADVLVQIGMAAKGVVEAQRILELALLDPKLELRGISVEQARAALRSAWIGVALAVLIPVGIAGFFGVLRLLRGTTALAGLRGLRNLQRAVEIDPVAVEALMRQVRDAPKLDQLLGLAGEAGRLQRLMARTLDVAQAELLLMHGLSAERLTSWVESLGSGSRMVGVLDRVPDTMTLELLASRYGDDIVRLESHLIGLGNDSGAALRLERLLDNAGGANGIDNLLVHCDDIAQLDRLTSGMIPLAKITELLDTTRSGAALESLIAHCDDVAQIEHLFSYGADPVRLATLVERAGSGTRMLSVLDRVPDIATMERLASTYADDMLRLEAHLAGLGTDAGASARLDGLLAKTGGLPQLETLLVRFDNINDLARAAQEIDTVQNLTTLLDAVGSGRRLAAFVEHAGGGTAGIGNLLRSIGPGDRLTAFLALVDANPAGAIALARSCESAPGLAGRLAQVFPDRALTSLRPQGGMIRFADEVSVAPVTLNSPQYTDDVLRRLADVCDNPAGPAARTELTFFERDPYRLRFRTNVNATVQPFVPRVMAELGLTDMPAVFATMTDRDAARLFEGLRDVGNATIRREGTRWALTRNPADMNQFVAYLEFFDAEVLVQSRTLGRNVQTAINEAIAVAEARQPGRVLSRAQREAIGRRITREPLENGGVGREFPVTTGQGFQDHVRDMVARQAGDGTPIRQTGPGGTVTTTTRAEMANAAWETNVREMAGGYAPGRQSLGVVDDAGLPGAIQGQHGSLSFGDEFAGSYHTHKHVRDDPGVYVPGTSDVTQYMDRARGVIRDGTPSPVRYNADGSRSVRYVRGQEACIVRVAPNGDAAIATYMPRGGP